ncbi:MAG: hypothetical protein JST45_10745 [Bacteroidetes bacterium]|nr:hypothetical protein [Bacteroidota bacterium]
MMKTAAPIMLAWGLALAVPATGQRKAELNTQAAVDEQVGNALAAEKVRGKLAELASEPGLRGSFIFDITVGDKGTVVTVFPVEWGTDDIPLRNRLKSCLMGIRFDFKVPKGKRFKTRQTLVFP